MLATPTTGAIASGISRSLELPSDLRRSLGSEMDRGLKSLRHLLTPGRKYSTPSRRELPDFVGAMVHAPANCSGFVGEQVSVLRVFRCGWWGHRGGENIWAQLFQAHQVGNRELPQRE
jgi:hypothetical protein